MARMICSLGGRTRLGGGCMLGGAWRDAERSEGGTSDPERSEGVPTSVGAWKGAEPRGCRRHLAPIGAGRQRPQDSPRRADEVGPSESLRLSPKGEGECTVVAAVGAATLAPSFLTTRRTGLPEARSPMTILAKRLLSASRELELPAQPQA
jgi:hypothetical protein